MKIGEWLDRIGWFCAFFTVVDMCFVWWGAIRGGGSICCGDAMIVLQIELFVVAPITILWLLSKVKRS